MKRLSLPVSAPVAREPHLSEQGGKTPEGSCLLPACTSWCSCCLRRPKWQLPPTSKAYPKASREGTASFLDVMASVMLFKVSKSQWNGRQPCLKMFSGRNQLTNYDQLNRMFLLWRTQVERDPDKKKLAFEKQAIHSGTPC